MAFDLAQLSRFEVALHVAELDGVELRDAVPVFHRWIQEQPFDDLLIDVVDYRHVGDAPTVLLVSDVGVYSLTSRGGSLRFSYARRRPFASDIDVAERWRRVLHAGWQAAVALAAAWPTVELATDAVEIVLRDRLVAPNEAATRAAAAQRIGAALRPLCGDVQVGATEDDPRACLRLNVRFDVAAAWPERLRRLEAEG